MYLTDLCDEERQMLLEIIQDGEIKAHKFKRAHFMSICPYLRPNLNCTLLTIVPL